MDSWNSPSRLSFESAFKLNQSLQIKSNANEASAKHSIISPTSKITTHSTSKPKKRIAPFEESKSLLMQKNNNKEIRPRTSSRKQDDLLSMYHINLANYIEEHKIDVKLTGTKRFSGKSGDYYLKNILFQNKEGSPNKKTLPELSLKHPESFNSRIATFKDMKSLEPHSGSLTARLPYDALTPIPIIEKTKVSRKFDSAALSNAERYAVHIRRLEYSKGILRSKSAKKEDVVRLGKIALIQKWWKELFAIKRIQRCFKGWNYRRKLYAVLKVHECIIKALVEFENKRSRYNLRYFLRKIKNFAFGQMMIIVLNNFSSRLLKKCYLKWKTKALEMSKMLQQEKNNFKNKELNSKLLEMLFSNLNNDIGENDDNDKDKDKDKEKDNLSSKRNTALKDKRMLLRQSETVLLEDEERNLSELFALCKKFTIWKCKSSGRYVTLLNVLVHFKKQKNDKVSLGVNNLIKLLREKLKESLLKVSVYENKPKRSHQTNKRIMMIYEYKSHSANHSKRHSKTNISLKQGIRRVSTSNVNKKQDAIVKGMQKFNRMLKGYWFNALRDRLNSAEEIISQLKLLGNFEEQLLILNSGKKVTSVEKMLNRKIQKDMNDLIANSGMRDENQNDDGLILDGIQQDAVALTFNTEQEKEKERNNDQHGKDLLLNGNNSVFQDIYNDDDDNKAKKGKNNNDRKKNLIEDISLDIHSLQDKDQEDYSEDSDIRKSQQKVNTASEENDSKEYCFEEDDNKHYANITHLKSKRVKLSETNEQRKSNDQESNLLLTHNKTTKPKNQIIIGRSSLSNADEMSFKDEDMEQKKASIKNNKSIEKNKDKAVQPSQNNKQLNIKEEERSKTDQNEVMFGSDDISVLSKSNEQKNREPYSNKNKKEKKSHLKQDENDSDDDDDDHNTNNKKSNPAKSKGQQDLKDDDNEEEEDKDEAKFNKKSNNYYSSETSREKNNKKSNLSPPDESKDITLSDLIKKMKQNRNQLLTNDEQPSSKSSIKDKEKSAQQNIALNESKTNQLLPNSAKPKSPPLEKKELKRNKSDFNTNQYESNNPSSSTKIHFKSRAISLNKDNTILKEYPNYYIQPTSHQYINNILGLDGKKSNLNQLKQIGKVNVDSDSDTNQDDAISKNKQNNTQQKEEHKAKEKIENKLEDNRDEIEKTLSNSDLDSGSNERMGSAIKTIMNKALDTNTKVSSSNSPNKVFYSIVSNKADNKTKSNSFLIVEEEHLPIETQTFMSKISKNQIPQISQKICQNILYKKLSLFSNLIPKLIHNNPSVLRYYYLKWNRKPSKCKPFVHQLIQSRSHLFKTSKSIDASISLFIAFNQWKNSSMKEESLQTETESETGKPSLLQQFATNLVKAKEYAHLLTLSQVKLVSQTKLLFNKWKDKVYKSLIPNKLKALMKKYKFVKSITFDLYQYNKRKHTLIDYFFKWKYSPLNVYCANIVNRKIKKVIVKPMLIRDYPTMRTSLQGNAFQKWEIKANGIDENENQPKGRPLSIKQIKLLTLAGNFSLIKRHSQCNKLIDKERAELILNDLKSKEKLLYSYFWLSYSQRIDILRAKFSVWSTRKIIRKNKLQANKKCQSSLFIVKSIKPIGRKRIQKYFLKWVEATLQSLKDLISLNTIISYKETKDKLIKGRNKIMFLVMRRKINHWRLGAVHCKQTQVYLKSMIGIYSKSHLSIYLVKWYNMSTQYSLKELKLLEYLMKDDRLLSIEHLLNIWKRKSFRSKKRYVYLHLIRRLTQIQKAATKPQRSIQSFFNKAKFLHKRNKILMSLFNNQYYHFLSSAFRIWKSQSSTLKQISHIKRIGKLFMKRIYLNNLMSCLQIIQKGKLLTAATQIIKHHTLRRFFGRKARNILKARRLSQILNHIYESKSLSKWRQKILLHKRERVSSFIHFLGKSKKLKVITKLKYFSLKNTILKSTALLFKAISKYPFSVLKHYLKSSNGRGFNSKIVSNSNNKNALYLESIKTLKDQMNEDESKENTPKITSSKKMKTKIKIKKNKSKNSSNNDNSIDDKSVKKHVIDLNDKNAFDNYHNMFSLVNSCNKTNVNETMVNSHTERIESTNELDNVLKTKQLKSFNYEILSGNDIIDKSNNICVSQSLKSYTDYLSQLSNQLDNYQHNTTTAANTSNQSKPPKRQKSTTTTKVSSIQKVTKKTSKENTLFSLFKRKIDSDANKMYLLELEKVAKRFKRFSNLCYAIKITFLHKNHKKLSTLKKLIIKWKQMALKSKLSAKTNEIVYKNMSKLHQKDTEEILGDNSSSYQSQIKKSVNNFVSFPIQEEKTMNVRSKKADSLVLKNKSK